ncbi:hypothetical protein CEE69_01295 [Rhodopirellula bahusiensis]|uniref:Uncharacterized protein n=2 Tax=Rhodopirellula bahusiensis TaxID=2014065 RepID=A0A2G1WDB5_9BACT|nr:hypothetical protein CEE69_01295 [Rhodopirellula bahusiensis]
MKSNERQRLWSRWRVYVIVMILLVAYGSPRTFLFNGAGLVGNAAFADEPKEPVVGTQTLLDKTSVFAMPPHTENSDNDQNTATTDLEEQEKPNEPAPNVFSMVTPKAKQYNPAVLRALERKRSILRALIEKLKDNRASLAKEGDQTWKRIQTLAASAFKTNNPSIASKDAQQAIDLLVTIESDFTYANFREEIRGKDASEILSALVDFSVSHPEHPRLSDLERSLKRLTHDNWLSMASGELKAAAPDDSGFSEGWLPIASAWQLVGNGPEAREAMRQAIEALPRMTKPERVVESIFEICQHPSFDRSLSRELIADAAEMCEQVSNKRVSSNYLANLSGLSKTFGLDTEAASLFRRSVASVDRTEMGSVWQKETLTQEARTASWTEPPEAVFAICAKMEKLRYPKPLITANAYGHAAIAAARRNDQPQFFKAMLLTENTFAPRRIYDFPEYLYTTRLAEANILQRRWRAAIVVANNVPDPYLRASYLFRVMRHAPQDVPLENLQKLFEQFSEQRWASPACASYAEHRVRTGESLLSIAEWSTLLPSASMRAAAFAGIARTAGTKIVANDFGNRLPLSSTIDVEDVNSLLDEAEQSAYRVQQSLDAASAWLVIARTSQLLDKTGRYEQAVSNLNDNLFDAWTEVWSQRPPVKRSYNGGYIDTSDRHRKQEERMIAGIIDCYRHLAEMQTDFGDSRGAMETLLNWANAAGFRSSTATFNDDNFLRMKALLNRLQGATGVGSESLPLANHHFYRYSRAMVAAWSKDIPNLEQLIAELTEKSQKRGNSSSDRMYPARAFSELAILHAERGNIESYRDARRSAQSLIARGSAGPEMKLALATSDALAGEFALAESNLVRGTLLWFGDASRPRSQLAVSLAANGQLEKAIGHAQRISSSQSFYRTKAWAAIAEARRKGSSESVQELLEWTDSMGSQVDRAAVFCGLAVAAASR